MKKVIMAGFVVCCALAGCREAAQQGAVNSEQQAEAVQAPEPGAVIQFDEQSFNEKVLKGTGVALVDFYADWCPPCRMQGPVVEELAGEDRRHGAHRQGKR